MLIFQEYVEYIFKPHLSSLLPYELSYGAILYILEFLKDSCFLLK